VRIACGATDGSIRILTVEDLEVEDAIEFTSNVSIEHIFSSSDGLYLIAYYNDKNIRKWNIKEKTVEMEINI